MGETTNLINKSDLMDRLSGLSSFGCNADEFAGVLEEALSVSSLTTNSSICLVGCNRPEGPCFDSSRYCMDCKYNSKASVAVSPLAYADTVYTTISSPPPIMTSFTCPYCGTHYIARDPGFIPNCHNCNGVMRKDKE